MKSGRGVATNASRCFETRNRGLKMTLDQAIKDIQLPHGGSNDQLLIP
jgi:hypothetical protein